jgi:hypothetical protein
MRETRQTIARGYEPVAKLDTNIMASPKSLAKMGFPTSEINKIDIVAMTRKHFVKISKELAKVSKKGKLEFNKVLASPKNPICDICGNSIGLGIVKLTSTEQETKIPSGWALVRFGSPNDSDYRAYMIAPLGIVIDYQGGKVYMVCGNCQLVLGLRATESGILIHEIRKGYGFVDLDRVEKVIQEHKK